MNVYQVAKALRQSGYSLDYALRVLLNTRQRAWGVKFDHKNPSHVRQHNEILLDYSISRHLD